MHSEEKRLLKWTAVLVLAVIVSAITAILVFVYCDGKEQTDTTQKQTVAVDGDGNEIIDGQAMPINMSFVRTSAANRPTLCTQTRRGRYRGKIIR